MYRSLADAIRDAESRGITLSAAALELESADAGRPVEEIRAALRRA
jgi:L-serine dehydratase